MFKTCRTRFRQWIYVDDGAAATFRRKQSRQHARMIRTGILSDDEDRVTKIEILEHDRALAETERLFHSGAAGFMTHVRAVGQVVRSKLSYEKLIKKCSFVAGAT